MAAYAKAPSPLPAPTATDYYVGWICAVEIEYVVAQELVEQRYPTPYCPEDDNAYFCGRIAEHNVVIACLPLGKYGTANAAICATNMIRSFPNLTVRLMVGIGGGAPSPKNDIRLGDIVVSKPVGRTGGVIHYEYGKTIQNRRFEWTGFLNSPAPALLNATNQLAARHRGRGHRINQIVDGMLAHNQFLLRDYSKPEVDVLYESNHLHPQYASGPCQRLCGTKNIIRRVPRPRTQNNPEVHYGLIASADRLVKNAVVRDELAATEGVLCFETEAAGLMDSFQCLVIRGICDYSDTHKNDLWQGYAAAVAAAYAKELLEIIPAREVPAPSPRPSYVQSTAPPSPYISAAAPAAPVAGGEVDKNCKYCREWRSWAYEIGCPLHCSQCPAKEKPGRWTRAFNTRSSYFSKDEMCVPHIRQRELREAEEREILRQRAAIEAQEQGQTDMSGFMQNMMLSAQSSSSSCYTPQPQNYCQPPPQNCRPKPASRPFNLNAGNRAPKNNYLSPYQSYGVGVSGSKPNNQFQFGKNFSGSFQFPGTKSGLGR